MDRLVLLFVLCIAPGIGSALDVAVNISETAKEDTEVWSLKDYRNCSLSGGKSGPTIEKYFWLDMHDDTISLMLEKALDLEVLVSDNVFLSTSTVINVRLECERKDSSKETVIVTIHIVPVNEFSPVFQHPPFEVEVEENIPKGSTIFSLKDKIKDKDAFKFNKIVSFDTHLYLIGALDGRPYFSVDKQTGVVTTRTEVDYEQLERHNFVLNITATDDGGLESPPISLNVNITDIDDMPPQFYDPQHPGCRTNCSMRTYSHVIDIHFQGDLEDVKPYRVAARDSDRGVDAKINYSIEYDTGDEFESNIFIDDVTGVLQVLVPYDNFTNVTSGNTDDPFFVTVTLVATELGVNRRSVNASFTLTVYRVLPTSPPPTTPTTSSNVTMEAHHHDRDDDDSSTLLLVEILVPCCLSVLILVSIIIVFLLKRQKRKEMKYQVKEKEKETRRQGDMMESLPATMASPYDLVGAYAHFDLGTYDRKGAGDANDAPTEQSQDEYNGILANSFDGLYTKVKKKMPRQAKMRAVDIVEAEYADGEDNGAYDDVQHEVDTVPEAEQTAEEVETDMRQDADEAHGSYDLVNDETHTANGDDDVHGSYDLSSAGNNTGEVEGNAFGGEGGQFGSYNVAEYGAEVGYFGNSVRNTEDNGAGDNDWPEMDDSVNTDKQFNDSY